MVCLFVDVVSVICTLVFRIWSMTERALLGRKDLDQKARSAAFSPDGIHLAVGLMNGSFIVLRTK